MQPGAAHLGPFEIVAPIGEGAFGIVYRARRDGREVALKVMHPRDEGTSTAEIARFVAEADKMRRVHHPSLVPLDESGTLPDGRPYLSMPLLGERTLAAQVADRPWSAEAALDLFAGVAGAVAALHASGLIHRDIKPENVMVLPDRLVLLDLGIARDVSASPSTTTQAGMSRGTPAYMAPERLLGQQATIASDVYELALLLCVMILGRTPWTEGDAHARFAPVLDGTAIPTSWVPLLADALALDVGRRPDGVVALLESLRAAGPRLVPAATPSVVGLGLAPTERVASGRMPPDPPVPASGETPSSHATSSDARFVRSLAPPAAPPGAQRTAVVLAVSAVAAGAIGTGAFLLRGGEAAPGASSAPSPTVAIRASSTGDDLEAAPGTAAPPLPTDPVGTASATASARIPSPTASTAPVVATSTPSVAPSASPTTTSSAVAPPNVVLSPPCQRFVALMCSKTSGARPEECTAWRGNVAGWTRDLPPAVAADTCQKAFDGASNGLALRRRSGMPPAP